MLALLSSWDPTHTWILQHLNTYHIYNTYFKWVTLTQMDKTLKETKKI